MGTIVSYNRYVQPAPRSPQGGDSTTDSPVRELDAMRVIAETMASLPRETRSRVARWTEELYGGSATKSQAPPGVGAAPVAQPAADSVERAEPDLAVEDLEDFFQPSGSTNSAGGDDLPAARDRAAQDIADRTDLIEAVQACSLDVESVETGSLDVEAGAEPPAPPEQPVVSMIHGFVEEFQKLAREWEST